MAGGAGVRVWGKFRAYLAGRRDSRRHVIAAVNGTDTVTSPYLDGLASKRITKLAEAATTSGQLLDEVDNKFDSAKVRYDEYIKRDDLATCTTIAQRLTDLIGDARTAYGSLQSQAVIEKASFRYLSNWYLRGARKPFASVDDSEISKDVDAVGRRLEDAIRVFERDFCRHQNPQPTPTATDARHFA